AAFGNLDPTPDQLRAEAAAASIGHTAGAYAGLTFALLAGEAPGPDAQPAAETAETAAGKASSATDPAAAGTVASSDTGWLSQVEVRALASAYFKPEDVNHAIRVAWCESRFDPESVDLRDGGVGLFHHLPKYWDERTANAGFPGAHPTDPEASTAAAAWEVYKGGGWDVFTCRG
ncbi:MAG: hypothetical protein KY394_05735, partial [Actinobacteria bacterium]|nr:hypothetical protein [Actinomycetota bacterium]